MPGKKKKGGRSVKKGAGIGSFFKKAVRGIASGAKAVFNVAKKVVPVVAKTGVIGNLAAAYNPNAGIVAKAAGLGRRRGRGPARRAMAQGGRGYVTNEHVKVMAF